MSERQEQREREREGRERETHNKVAMAHGFAKVLTETMFLFLSKIYRSNII